VNPVPANALSFTLREPRCSRRKSSLELSASNGRWKLAPALAAGCTLYPEACGANPLTASRNFANWFEEVGFPRVVISSRLWREP